MFHVTFHCQFFYASHRFLKIYCIRSFKKEKKMCNVFSVSLMGCPNSSDGKASTCNAGDRDSVPLLGRFPGEGNDDPLQYSCLENSIDRGVWRAIVCGITKSLTWRMTHTHIHNMSAAAKLHQLCPILYDPIDGSPLGSTVPGILQTRTLEWVATSFNAWKWKVKVKSLSHVRLCATPWTAAPQAPLSMGFSRQEYWSGLPLPSPHNMSSCSKNMNN